jgi:hypothetical protein
MKQLLAWTGSADSTISSEAVMAMAEKFNIGQEVCLQIPSTPGVMQVKKITSGSIATGADPLDHVRFILVSDRTADIPGWLKRAERYHIMALI